MAAHEPQRGEPKPDEISPDQILEKSIRPHRANRNPDYTTIHHRLNGHDIVTAEEAFVEQSENPWPQPRQEEGWKGLHVNIHNPWN